MRWQLKQKRTDCGFGPFARRYEARGCPDKSGYFSNNRTRHNIFSKCLNWTKPAPAGGVGWWSVLKLSSPSAQPSHTPSAVMAGPSSSSHQLRRCESSLIESHNPPPPNPAVHSLLFSTGSKQVQSELYVVFLFVIWVVVPTLCVDDGGVGICCVVRSFGFVGEIGALK